MALVIARLLAWLTADAGPRYRLIAWAVVGATAVEALGWLWGRR